MAWAPFIVCFLSLALVFAAILHDNPRRLKNDHRKVLPQKKWLRNRRSIANQEKLWKRDISSVSENINQLSSDVVSKLDSIDFRISQLVDSMDEIKSYVKKMAESSESDVITNVEMGKIKNEMEAQIIIFKDIMKTTTTTTTSTPNIQVEDITTASSIPVSTKTCISTSARFDVDITSSSSSSIERETKCDLKSDQLFYDCKSATLNQGSGNYQIKFPFISKPLPVYCDRQWLVIQRRHFGNQTFNKGWLSYKHGFGNLCQDFWIGNEFLHNLTSNNSWSLMVEFSNSNGYIIGSAVYKLFRIGSEKTNYTLFVDGFQSDDSKDGLSFHNGSQFVTPDHGVNHLSIQCAFLEESGWWFSHTQYLHFTTCNHHLLGSNLNAPYIGNKYEIESKLLLFCISNTTRRWETIKFSNSLYWRGRNLATNEFSMIQMKMKMN